MPDRLATAPGLGCFETFRVEGEGAAEGIAQGGGDALGFSEAPGSRGDITGAGGERVEALDYGEAVVAGLVSHGRERSFVETQHSVRHVPIGATAF